MKHILAMAGFGGMAGWHYDLIEKIDGLTVAGIWDVKPERREYALSRNIHVYQSLEDLLADQSVDLVLVATPNDVHKSIAIQAMEAGKNVVSEKPVTLSSQDLREMIEASERTGRFLTFTPGNRSSAWSSRWTPQSSTMPPPCSFSCRQSPGMPREPCTLDSSRNISPSRSSSRSFFTVRKSSSHRRF